MKITKEYLRSLIVESLEEVHDVKFMAGYPGMSKDDKGEYVPHAGPVPRFTQSLHDITTVADNLRAEIGSVLSVYVKDEEAKKRAMEKLNKQIKLLEQIAEYLGSAQSKSAGYPDSTH